MQINTFPTLFVGQNRICLKEVDSTNDYLKGCLSNSEPLPEGTVIMAEAQVAGRGQQASVWHAEPGKNLTVSIYLSPRFLPIDKQFYLNMSVSLAVTELIDHYLEQDVFLKWPNDIYAGRKKLGGILIENTLSGSVLKNSVVGIGLNINQQDFGQEIAKRATSLKNILHRDVELPHLLNQLCSLIEKRYLQLRRGEFAALKKSYEDRLLDKGITRDYGQNGEVFYGTILGVSDGGKLRVAKPGGVEEFGFKEITYINIHS